VSRKKKKRKKKGIVIPPQFGSDRNGNSAILY